MSKTQEAVNATSQGSPWLILAFVLLTVLKVTGILAISWWVVTLPLWIVPALVLGGLVVAGIVYAIVLGIAALVKAF
jgi:hypothetical protein